MARAKTKRKKAPAGARDRGGNAKARQLSPERAAHFSSDGVLTIDGVPVAAADETGTGPWLSPLRVASQRKSRARPRAR